MPNLEDTLIVLENGKLTFNREALDILEAKAGDRIEINYWIENSSNAIPVIGKSELFTDSTNGNLLRKNKSISFRGEQSEILRRYGTKFILGQFKEYFKLVPIKESEEIADFKDELNSLNKLEDLKEIIF